MKNAIFYASNKGFAGDIAKRIASKLHIADVFDIKDTAIEKITEYQNIVLVVSTHADGAIQRDLQAQLDNFKGLNLQGKTIAIVGLGDGVGHGDTFNNAMGAVYDIIQANGGKTVGTSEATAYVYDETNALRDGQFPGLALDLPNQSLLNEERLDAWVKQVGNTFA